MQVVSHERWSLGLSSVWRLSAKRQLRRILLRRGGMKPFPTKQYRITRNMSPTLQLRCSIYVKLRRSWRRLATTMEFKKARTLSSGAPQEHTLAEFVYRWHTDDQRCTGRTKLNCSRNSALLKQEIMPSSSASLCSFHCHCCMGS
jgi:hypothetical protein